MGSRWKLIGMAWGAVSVYLRSTAPQGLALPFHLSPYLDRDISFVLPWDSCCGNTCCQQKDLKQSLSCCWHPRRMWLGKAMISPGFCPIVQSGGWLQCGSELFLDPWSPSTSCMPGGVLVSSGVELNRLPSPALWLFPLFCEFHFQILWHQDLRDQCWLLLESELQTERGNS